MTRLDEHYGRPDLGRIILTALRLAGKRVDALTPDDLAPCGRRTPR